MEQGGVRIEKERLKDQEEKIGGTGVLRLVESEVKSTKEYLHETVDGLKMIEVELQEK